MKQKIVAIFLMLCMYMPMVHADELQDSINNFGASIGAAMGARAAERAYLKGKVVRKVWADKTFDFSKIKSLLIATDVKGTNSDIHWDANIYSLHSYLLKKALQNKYLVSTFEDLRNYITNKHPDLKEGSEGFKKKMANLIFIHDAILKINIYSFYVANGKTNVSYDITMASMKDYEKDVFSYKESRFEVPYKSGYQLFEEITEKFVPKFEKSMKVKKSDDE